MVGKQCKYERALIILASYDFESLQFTLKGLEKTLSQKEIVVIILNGKACYNSSIVEEIAKKWESQDPAWRFIVKPSCAGGKAYQAIKEVLENTDVLRDITHICKIDDDIIPLRKGWLDHLAKAYADLSMTQGNVGFVTGLINNNNWGFAELIEIFEKQQEYLQIRDTAFSLKPAFTLPQKINAGFCGTIWQYPFLARWLHQWTSLQPFEFIRKTKDLEPKKIPSDIHYSIGCIYFEKSLWMESESENTDGSLDDETLLHRACISRSLSKWAVMDEPVLHLFYYTQRLSNKDILTLIADSLDHFFNEKSFSDIVKDNMDKQKEITENRVSGFSVIMPTYNQAAFIRRAVRSLMDQTYTEWELIVIDDGCTDNTDLIIGDYLKDSRVKYFRNEENKGLGYSINRGLDAARFNHIAYLPSDDFFYEYHLEVLKTEFERQSDAVLIFTRAKSGLDDSVTKDLKTVTNGLFDSHSLQLVQTAHKKTTDRWVTREEWVSEDLFGLFWYKLTDKGSFHVIRQITSGWSVHSSQHHKLVSEKYGGGLNKFRQYYKIQGPVKLKASEYKFIDEEKLYKNYQNIQVISKPEKPLKILLVGELAYNPERILALEEHGHKLYGLWMHNPTFSFSTVGHLPFGNVIDIPFSNWKKKVEEIKPDIIYALLNFGAIPLAYEVLQADTKIPFVWHFKEGPSVCQESGLWEQLIKLYHEADGKIYLNEEAKNWYEQFIPSSGSSFILDGDLPKSNYFTDEFSPRLSLVDGEIHTVVAGRIIGVGMKDIETLARHGVHIHLYTENYHNMRDPFNKEVMKIAPDHFHIHKHCSSDHWVKEFSQYDAGWLHCFESRNQGVLMRAEWDDLNMPARMNTLAAAGLPMIQKDNKCHMVAMQNRVKKDDLGVFFTDYKDLTMQLQDKARMETIRENVLKHRLSFSFDYHVPELIEFFYKIIETYKNKKHDNA